MTAPLLQNRSQAIGGLQSPTIAEPVVSVIMLAYNHGPYIRRAIEGVLQQKTSFPFELIIGEDCSTDNTREIVLEYQRKNPDIIRLITSEANVGAIANVRRTEAACRGRYIAHCEGDDYWHDPNKIQCQVDFLESHSDYALVHSDFRIHYLESGRIRRRFIGSRSDLDDADAFNEILSGRRNVLTVTACIRRSVNDAVIRECPECYDTRFLMGDTQRWLEIARRGKVKYLPEVFATHQLLPESATQSRDPVLVLRFSLSAKDVLEHYVEKYGCSSEARISAKTRSAIQLLRCAYEAGDAQVAGDALGEYRQVGVHTPLEARLYCWGSTSPRMKELVRPALTVVSLWQKVWRRVGRWVGRQ